MALYTCWICSVVYILYYAHDGYEVLCAYVVVHMLDMRCYIHMVLCTCCICNDMYIWCRVHVVHVMLCTYGGVCMIVHVELCACGVVYMLFMWWSVQGGVV